MTQEDLNQHDLKDRITSRGIFFVILWAAGILLLYAVGGYLGVRTLQGYRAETEKFRTGLDGVHGDGTRHKGP